MNTAEMIRRQQIDAHWRLHEHQLKVVEVLKPIAKLWGEKMRETYPDLLCAAGQSVKVRE